MKGFLKGLLKLVVFLLVLSVIGGVILYFAQGLITYPGRGVYSGGTSEWQARIASLSARGIAALEFAVEGGGTVKGIWAPCPQGGSPAVLWLHARHENVTELNQHVAPLRDLGYNVLAMEYRGYGDSGGETTEAGLLADAEAAIDHISKRDDVATGRIFVGGNEMGATLALKVAARKDVNGVIAVSPMPDMATAVSEQIPIVPVGFLLKDRYDLSAILPAVPVPVLFVYGSEDPIVPPAKVEALAAKMTAKKVLRIVPGARRKDVLEVGGKALFEEIGEFLANPHR